MIILLKQKMSTGQIKEEMVDNNEEHLIDQILNENIFLRSLPAQTMSEIAAIFKIVEKPNSDPSQTLAKIKQKLANIVNEEKEECVNYLQLPKFQSLSALTKYQLKEVLKKTWEDYQAKCAEKNSEGYEKYLCKSDNLKEVEGFHLRTMDFLKQYYFFPYNSQFMPQNSDYQMMGAGQPLENIPNQNSENYQMYGMSNVPNYSGNFQNLADPNPYFQNNYPPQIKMEDDFISGSAFKNQTFSENPKKRGKNKSFEEDPKIRIEKEVSQITNKQFWGCACRGRISAEERFFECCECKKRIHLSCLLIPAYAGERVGVKKICPQCSLKNNNAFYDVIGDPLETFWSDDKELHKQKITIKGKKCKQILEKKYCLQLRFLKVEGKSLFDWDDQIGNSDMVKQEGFHAPSSKPKKNSLNEILIKEDMLNRGNGEDVKINLDCMRHNETDVSQRKAVMIYVAIYIVRKKNLQEMLSEKYEEVEPDYLENFFKEGLEQIKIEVFESSTKLIETPVRGMDCDHVDVFDLEEFLDHSLGLQTDTCFFCGKKCRSFKVDVKIMNELIKIRQTIPDETRYPSAIYYRKDGTFFWKEEGADNESIYNPNPDDDDLGELDMGISDEMDLEDNESDEIKKEYKDDVKDEFDEEL